MDSGLKFAYQDLVEVIEGLSISCQQDFKILKILGVLLASAHVPAESRNGITAAFQKREIELRGLVGQTYPELMGIIQGALAAIAEQDRREDEKENYLMAVG